MNTKLELAGAVAGGMYASSLVPVTPHPLLTGALKLGAGLVGSGIGAATGRGLDVWNSAVQTQQDISTEHILNQMYDAGIADMALSAIIGSAISVSARTLGGFKKAWDYFQVSDIARAKKALKDRTGLTEDQINEQITKFEEVTKTKLSGTQAEKGVAVIAQTQKGQEDLIKKAMVNNPKAGAQLRSVIDKRAKDIIKEANNLTNDNIDSIVRSRLNNFAEDAVTNYGNVVSDGVSRLKDVDYSFDFDKLTLKPIIETTKGILHNTSALNRFEALVSNIKDVIDDPLTKAKRKDRILTSKQIKTSPAGEQTVKFTKAEDETLSLHEKLQKRESFTFHPSGETSTDIKETLIKYPEIEKEMLLAGEATNAPRSFENLIRLRVAVNDFIRSKDLKQFVDIKALEGVKKTIDNEITSVAKKYMQDPDEWLQNWKDANMIYYKHSELKKNVLAKALTNKSLNTDKVVDSLMKSLEANDPAFSEVFEVIPSSIRSTVEGSIVQKLTAKNTVDAQGVQAIDFSKLDDALSNINFKFEKNRNYKRAIKEMSRVFHNDIDLIKIAEPSEELKISQGLTADLRAKLKYMLASRTFTAIMRKFPGAAGNTSALIRTLGDVLNNPLDSKSIDTLTKSLPDDPELASNIKSLALQIGKVTEKTDYEHATLYKAVPKSQGKGGSIKGVYYSRKEDIKKVGEGRQIAEYKVMYKNLKTLQEVRDILGNQNIEAKDILDSSLNQEIIKKAYGKGIEGIEIDNKVMVFER
jgi:hypothetical protein